MALSSESLKAVKVLANVPHICFTIFLMLWLDGTVQWDFWIVFIPAWVEMVILLITFFVSLHHWCKSPPELRAPAASLFGAVIVAVPVLLFCCFLVARLQQEDPWKYVYVGIPVYVLGGISLIAAFVRPRTRSLVNIAIVSVPVSVFVLLVALRLDLTITSSWVVVFIPLWILYGVVSLLLCSTSCCAGLSLPARKSMPLFASAGVWQLLVATFAVALAFLFALFVSLMMDSVVHWTWYCSLLLSSRHFKV